MSSAIAKLTGRFAYYLSAEQSPGEIRLTADRLQIPNLDRFVVLQSSSGGGAEVDSELLQAMPPALFVVDSLSALHGKDTHGQVLTCKRYKQLAVATKAPAILILHMTKTGDIQGKAELHHETDAIMCMDPAPHHMGNGVRELISYKNRFGPSHQPKYLVMTPTGLAEAPPKEKRKRRAQLDDGAFFDAPPAHDEPPPVSEPQTKNRLRAVPRIEEEPPRRRGRVVPTPDVMEVKGQKLVRKAKKRAQRAEP
jgi:predicted ATP-dependent serine protease